MRYESIRARVQRLEDDARCNRYGHGDDYHIVITKDGLQDGGTCYDVTCYRCGIHLVFHGTYNECVAWLESYKE